MDTSTIEAIKKTLPDPTIHPENEYYYYGRATDKIENKFVDVQVLFKKDATGKSWVYIETKTTKGSTQEP